MDMAGENILKCFCFPQGQQVNKITWNRIENIKNRFLSYKIFFFTFNPNLIKFTN